jgi:superkiller protein 8
LGYAWTWYDNWNLATNIAPANVWQSRNGSFTASGHENGSVYVFNNESGRLAHSLAGLVHPVRSVAFSPASKLLAAGGDARVIALYDVTSGEQVANFSGHGGWILSLDWSDTGEYLLSGYVTPHLRDETLLAL